MSERHLRRSTHKVGDVTLGPVHRLSCHCGAVQIDLDLPHGLLDPRRCDCWMCRRRGAIVASVSLDGLHVLQGEDVLRLYQFNTQTAAHYFCGACGIYTHHRRRSNPNECGYNVGCLEGVNPYALNIAVPVEDGVNHLADRVTAAS
ncbi:GFA family protein [Xanthomonas oryzae]|uniref:GFA family protein n=1 Tax=Xanthomonas oryzae TaxID=347 RepID=UPI000643D966|nr:GFA family protein [Xanthomonas oryzae]AKK62616.1 aldehyde-activating protein [Xanthomonas oryzae pv. oryzicola]MEC5079222.1 GFA family protein [Xanthomonas oryzae pv. oryzicola]MEC5114997.1 GFA family protein [Xanthomonas oryzae pv. oryzicola]